MSASLNAGSQWSLQIQLLNSVSRTEVIREGINFRTLETIIETTTVKKFFCDVLYITVTAAKNRLIVEFIRIFNYTGKF